MLFTFNQLLFIAMGGAIGAVLRFVTSNAVHAVLGRGFLYGTLTVNVVGSFLMGVLYIILIERSGLPEQWRAVLIIGLLGAFTTFSTFSIETFLLIENRELAKALLNVFLSVSLCLSGTWAGVIIGRSL